MERADVVVIGAGHAGLAIAQCLSQHGVVPAILERAQVAQTWRDERWDSFTLVTPNWMVQLPGWDASPGPADGFLTRDQTVAWLERYRDFVKPDLRCGVDVQGLEPAVGGGFRLETSGGELHAREVVVAAGPFQRPSIPELATQLPRDVFQLHAGAYRNPAQLPPGRVLVVGSGQSGAQIADELLRSGREVDLSLGRSGRFPRRYRGRDGMAWVQAQGAYDRTVATLPGGKPPREGSPHVTGIRGGEHLFLRALVQRGLGLRGALKGCSGMRLVFSEDVPDRVQRADAWADDFERRVDAYIRTEGIDAPPPDAAPERTPILPTDARANAHDFSAIVWATGFRTAFPWLHLPVFDDAGQPRHRRGVTSVPGLYFLGLPWLWTMKSGLIFGIREDARALAEHIANRLHAP